MRLWLVLVGLVLLLVGLFASPLGPVTWVPFLGGFVLMGVGLMLDSKSKAAGKARMRTRNRGY